MFEVGDSASALTRKTKLEEQTNKMCLAIFAMLYYQTFNVIYHFTLLCKVDP